MAYAIQTALYHLFKNYIVDTMVSHVTVVNDQISGICKFNTATCYCNFPTSNFVKNNIKYCSVIIFCYSNMVVQQSMFQYYIMS